VARSACQSYRKRDESFDVRIPVDLARTCLLGFAMCLALLLSEAATAASVTVPLIVAGNAPIVNVLVKNAARVRMARCR
jgi:hypothetical protein